MPFPPALIQMFRVRQSSLGVRFRPATPNAAMMRGNCDVSLRYESFDAVWGQMGDCTSET